MRRKVFDSSPSLFLPPELGQHSGQKRKCHGSRIRTKARALYPFESLLVALEIELDESPMSQHPGEKYVAWTETHRVINMGNGFLGTPRRAQDYAEIEVR